MICLTGDIHHWMRGARNQEYFEEPELNLGYRYLRIAKDYGHKVTFFITGKSIALCHNSLLMNMLHLGNLEIGGHTYYALRPRLLHSFFKLSTGSVYGPKPYQRWDIKRTLRVIERKIGIPVRSWRTHGYSSDSATPKLLAQEGVSVISDDVDAEKKKATLLRDGIFSLPINVLPDHEHLYHGDRTEENLGNNLPGKQNGFTSDSFYIKDYFDQVKQQIDEIISSEGIATVLIHPACMYLADGFQEFEKFCRWMAERNYETIFARDSVKYCE